MNQLMIELDNNRILIFYFLKTIASDPFFLRPLPITYWSSSQLSEFILGGLSVSRYEIAAKPWRN